MVPGTGISVAQRGVCVIILKREIREILSEKIEGAAG
jgi:hypothetical protein